MKELRIDVAYLASTYGIVLDKAFFEDNDKGESVLVLLGDLKEKR